MRYRLGHNGRSPLSDDFLTTIQARVAGLGGALSTGDGAQGAAQEMVIQFRLATAVDLTPREMDVIRLLAEGLSNKEMAHILSVSPRTINFHLDNIYAKLGVSSRTEAAVYALRQGWIRQEPV